MSLFDSQRFATQIKVKRGQGSLRETSKEIGVSASTLLRLEQGKTPEMKAFIAICDWLGVEPDEFMTVNPLKATASMECIELILRNETKIPVANINAIMIILRSLHECAEQQGGAQ